MDERPRAPRFRATKKPPASCWRLCFTDRPSLCQLGFPSSITNACLPQQLLSSCTSHLGHDERPGPNRPRSSSTAVYHSIGSPRGPSPPVCRSKSDPLLFSVPGRVRLSTTQPFGPGRWPRCGGSVPGREDGSNVTLCSKRSCAPNSRPGPSGARSGLLTGARHFHYTPRQKARPAPEANPIEGPAVSTFRRFDVFFQPAAMSDFYENPLVTRYASRQMARLFGA